jgi:hypothetical protein
MLCMLQGLPTKVHYWSVVVDHLSVWRHAACYEEYVSFCAAVRALGASGVCICVCVFVCVSGCQLFVCFKVQYPSIKLLYNAVFQLCTSS